MTWTRKIPTEIGHYWVRPKGEEPRIVRVSVIGAHSKLFVDEYRQLGSSGLDQFAGAEWFGPLQVPEGSAP